MTKKVYYLKTCDTTRRILKDVSEYLDGTISWLPQYLLSL